MKPSHARLVAILILLFGAGFSLGQYTDPVYINDVGGPDEFARRRAELAKQVKSGTIILFARVTLPESNHYREDNDFFYYTGLADPGAVMVMDAGRQEAMIFEPEQSQRTKQVYGASLLAMTAQQREKLGYKAVAPISTLDNVLALVLGTATDLWLRLTFPDKADGARPEVGRDYAEEYAAPYGDPTPGDRAAIMKLAQRYPAAHQRDLTPFIDGMRNIKTP